MKINSSLEIRCSTSDPDILGLSLHRHFQRKEQILYLSLKNESITKESMDPDFKGRIQRSRHLQRVGDEYMITLQLSLQKLEDTDLYYCQWTSMDAAGVIHRVSSNGTVVIVRGERMKQSSCIRRAVTICLLYSAFSVQLFPSQRVAPRSIVETWSLIWFWFC